VTKAEQAHSRYSFGYTPKRSKGTRTSNFTQFKLIFYNNQAIQRTDAADLGVMGFSNSKKTF